MNRTGASAGRALKRIFRQDDILSRIEDQPAESSLLMNPVRLKTFILLTEKPCMHTRAIARSAESSLTNVKWHLGKLNENGYIESHEHGVKRIYWPASMVSDKDALLIHQIGQEPAIAILQGIKSKGKRQKELMEETGMKQQNIDYWLKKLEKNGILSKDGEGVGAHFTASSKVHGLIELYDSAAREYSAGLLELFRMDGLMPRDKRFRGTRLSVSINLPSGRRRIHLECSPMARARRILL